MDDSHRLSIFNQQDKERNSLRHSDRQVISITWNLTKLD